MVCVESELGNDGKVCENFKKIYGLEINRFQLKETNSFRSVMEYIVQHRNALYL